MQDADLRLDGNAAAGLLGEIFDADVTVWFGTCAACGLRAQFGSVHVYAHAPGVVLRCPRCEAILLRVVQAESRYWLEARGIRSLEL